MNSRVFRKIHGEDVVTPRTDGRSRCYAFVTLSWARASNVNPFDICKLYSGILFVNSRAIYIRKPDNTDETQSSIDSVSSSFIEWEHALEGEDRWLSKIQKRLKELERRDAAPIQ